MIVYILLLVGIIITSFELGYKVGIKRGIAIKDTIMTLVKESDKLGMKDTFKNAVDDVFDGSKPELWEEDK